MTAFLILMYLLSLALGYACAFDCSTRELWRSTRTEGLPEFLQQALTPPWQRRLLRGSWLAALLGIGYGFWRLGIFPGAGLAFCFILAAKIGERFLLHRMRNLFHLNLVLRAVLRRQADYMKAGDMDRAKALEGVIQKVALNLYALKAARCASQVPACPAHLEHLKVPDAKADNYDSLSRTRRGK